MISSSAVEDAPFGQTSTPRAAPISNSHLMYEKKLAKGPNFKPTDLTPPQKLKRKVQKPTTPQIPGRITVALQTNLYLEEIEPTVPVSDTHVQTDMWLDRPASPLYVPVKSGTDVGTQIYEGELFDFDVEVEGILEVLVGKVVEQAWMEVLEEEELLALKTHQLNHEIKRNVEFAEVQRLEEAERRRENEKNRRIMEEEKIYQEKKAITSKLAAQAMSRTMLKNLIPSVMAALTSNGYFYDVVEREVEQSFLPWLSAQVNGKLSDDCMAFMILDDMIRESITAYGDGVEAGQQPGV